MKKIKHKLPKFIDINTFDFTPYCRELTREEAYRENGGQVMSQADQYAMAQAHARGDKETMDKIVSKYENKDEQNALTVEGSGINCYFDSPVPNFIDNNLTASNNNCWREKI